jgi:hypothetical protein
MWPSAEVKNQHSYTSTPIRLHDVYRGFTCYIATEVAAARRAPNALLPEPYCHRLRNPKSSSEYPYVFPRLSLRLKVKVKFALE